MDDANIVELTDKVLTAIAFVITVEADMVEFSVNVLPVIVEKTIWLVDIVFVLIDEANIVEFTDKVLTAIAFVITVEADMVEFRVSVLPVMLEKEI